MSKRVVIETQRVMARDGGPTKGTPWNAIKVTKGNRKAFVIAGEENSAPDAEFALHHAIKRIRQLERKLSAEGKKQALEETLAERCQTLTQERDAALEREAALWAQALELKECISDGNEMLGELRKLWQKKMPKSAQDVQDQIDHAEKLIIAKTSSTLNRRDLLQRAEEVESFADNANPSCDAQDVIVRKAYGHAEQLRQRAQELT